MKVIPMTNCDLFAIVSDSRYDYLTQWNWQTNKDLYAGTTINNQERLWMHIEVAKLMGLNTTQQIDHKDRNPLNNLDDNLRSATLSQNRANVAIMVTNKTGFKGVSYKKSHGKYAAQIKVNGTVVHLGLFDCPIKAARCYDCHAKFYHKEFAFLNFPEESS